MSASSQENCCIRFKSLAAFALLVLVAVPAMAQEDYTEFTSKEDRFTITFPGKPTLGEGTWTTEHGIILPSKVYSVSNITGRHTLTIVDYTPLERIMVEKSKRCPEGADDAVLVVAGFVAGMVLTGRMRSASSSLAEPAPLAAEPQRTSSSGAAPNAAPGSAPVAPAPARSPTSVRVCASSCARTTRTSGGCARA